MRGLWLAEIFAALGLAVTVKPDLVPVMLATVAVIIATVIQVAWVKVRSTAKWITCYSSALRLLCYSVA